jgi:hypothetical protein
MPARPDVHQPLRQAWVETAPDISYRFVVSRDTLRAAVAMDEAIRLVATSRWERAIRLFLQLTIVASVAISIMWLSSLGYWAAHPMLGAVATFVVLYLVLLAVLKWTVQPLARFSLDRSYREHYAGNEFCLEGRDDFVWFEDQSAGAIRRWSTFEHVFEFEGGMWLMLRRSTTFAGYRGLLISRESLPGSCDCNDLHAYLRQRIARHADQTDKPARGSIA